MKKQGPLGGKVRLKLVAVGGERVLSVRFGSFTGHAQSIAQQLVSLVPPPQCVFDGDVYTVRGEAAVRKTVTLLRQTSTPVYDPNLLRSGVPALPNPWPIPEEPLKSEDRPIVFMARVWHPDMAESIAFQLPEYDDDFMIAFRRRRIPKTWRKYRKDLKIWVVADHYQPLVHDVLDEFYDCRWDEMLGGDEWNVLPPPKSTQYPIRGLRDADFRIVGVEPGCQIWELQAAYRDKKEAYRNNNLDPDEWYEVDTAFQRIDRHYRPRDPDAELPEQVAAPRGILLGLRSLFDSERERVLWYYRYQDALGDVPAEIGTSELGERRIVRCLELMALAKAKSV